MDPWLLVIPILPLKTSERSLGGCAARAVGPGARPAATAHLSRAYLARRGIQRLLRFAPAARYWCDLFSMKLTLQPDKCRMRPLKNSHQRLSTALMKARAWLT